jgi:Endonuclease-reverse transcriptase
MYSLNAMSSSLKPKIIAVTETWFTTESNKTVSGYTSYTYNRPSHGGGVALYVIDNIESFEVSNEVFSDSVLEQIWCGLRFEHEKILMGCIYRPPPKPNETRSTRLLLEHSLNQSLIKASSLVRKGEFDGMCICGDFNYNNTTWDSDNVPYCHGGLTALDHNFLITLTEHFIHQSVTTPTFVNASGNCVNFLDLILTESPERTFNIVFHQNQLQL